MKVASSVIFVRPRDDTYEILLLRRNPNLSSFGGYYAFPGGIIEDQDTYEHWLDIAPDFVKKNDYFDFNKRVSAVRESFEEVNFLMTSNSKDNLRDEYLKADNFATYCKSKEMEPDLANLKAYLRVGSPVNHYPVFDAQFYFYFVDEKMASTLQMNHDEFTDAKWLTVAEALHMFKEQELALFVPQVIVLSRLMFTGAASHNLASLKAMLEHTDKIAPSYLSQRNHIFMLGHKNFKSDAARQKHMKLLFDDDDYKPDSERNLFVFTNEKAIAEDEDLAVFSENAPPRTTENMLAGLKKVALGLMYGDFYGS